MNQKINKQNFRMDITSGSVVELEKQTIENIQLALREKNMGRNQNKPHASRNTFKAVSTGFVSCIKNNKE